MRTCLLLFILTIATSVSAQTSDSLSTKSHDLATDLLATAEEDPHSETISLRTKKLFPFGGSRRRTIRTAEMPKPCATIRRIQGAQPGMPYSTIGAGVRYSLFALEANLFSGEERKWWYLTPKANVDFGHVSVFYGYGLPVGANNLPGSFRHNLSVKYKVRVEELFPMDARKQGL